MNKKLFIPALLLTTGLSANADAFVANTLHNSINMVNMVRNEISNRLSDGVGDSNKSGTWMNVFYNHLKDKSGASNKANNNGLIIGLEESNSDIKVGGGYSYIDSRIHGSRHSTTADSHIGFVYGEYKPSDLFVNVSAQYMWSEYNEKHIIAKSKYDVDAFSIQAMVGYDMGNITPSAGLRYTNVDKEHHRNGRGDRFPSNNSDVVTAVMGVKLSEDVVFMNEYTVNTQFRVAGTYDLSTDNDTTYTNQLNGQRAFLKQDRLKRAGVEVAFSLKFNPVDDLDLEVGYTGEFREHYDSHGVHMGLGYSF